MKLEGVFQLGIRRLTRSSRSLALMEVPRRRHVPFSGTRKRQSRGPPEELSLAVWGAKSPARLRSSRLAACHPPPLSVTAGTRHLPARRFLSIDRDESLA
jgi:hypothetical protein